ncbi:unnamed protein product [Adineta steineri]|uniref:Uncharacterized protein n=1 Tax=Adineta steineri TaxID=433720 RepID=A0A815UII6_9BILA|nr:unnamed protein product [Adineta steineri]CAF1648230.1 unnamed protein product [Adineta steineri]
MATIKRNLTFKELSEENPKKLRSELNSIENLSNEIFDYLDGLDICIAFSNVNYRFQQLIICSSEEFLNNYKQIQHQIYSIDCSFDNLQSIRIDNIPKDKLIVLPIHLSELPCLYPLNIQTTDSIEDLDHIYQLIFS